LKDALFSKRESRGKEGSQTGWGGHELISSPPRRLIQRPAAGRNDGHGSAGTNLVRGRPAALAPTLSGDGGSINGA